MFNELDTVVLARDLKAHNLTRGDAGTVAHCQAGGKAYEVEFVTGEGKTVAVLTLEQVDIRPMRRHESISVMLKNKTSEVCETSEVFYFHTGNPNSDLKFTVFNNEIAADLGKSAAISFRGNVKYNYTQPDKRNLNGD